ncbi:malonate decarboxylase holo-[acyl-carrier-protein] synthase [Undibacterium terreum]|nr:malonate decarboxylase holo-[acyl-carrier-protein] synthase [Undibacterium terreum]
MMLQRHDLVYLSGDGWQQLAMRASEADLPVIRRWQGADWPVIVRRHEASQREEGSLAPDHKISLGLALPPDPIDGSKRRMALSIGAQHVARRQRPLSLLDAAPSAPERWREALALLDAAAKERGFCLQVFGSLAMQRLTGMQYLTPRSDIDILFRPDSSEQLQAGLDLLADLSNRLPLDGEVIFPGEQAVSWKEVAAGIAATGVNGTRVLSKCLNRVSLQPLSSLLLNLDGG